MIRSSRPAARSRAASRSRAVACVPVLLLMLAAAACAPRLQPPGPLAQPGLARPGPVEPAAAPIVAPEDEEAAVWILPGPGRIAGDRLVMPDGMELPLRVWQPEGEPRAAVIALHGFNDHSLAWEQPGSAWAEQGLVTYAYDQRGFGAAGHRGIWPGWPRLAGDLWSAAAAVQAAHPGLPLFLVGESMGGAVVLAAFGPEMAPARDAAGRPPVAGAILSAPAVWGRTTMPAFYRWGLWFAAHTVPWHPVSGSGLGRQASDNVQMLRDLWLHPLTIRETRTDAVWGLVNLMDVALQASDRIDVPVLTLYGEKDEIVPPGPIERMRARLPETAEHRTYPEGWHLLFRDLGARAVWDDTAAWMLQRAGAS